MGAPGLITMKVFPKAAPDEGIEETVVYDDLAAIEGFEQGIAIGGIVYTVQVEFDPGLIVPEAIRSEETS